VVLTQKHEEHEKYFIGTRHISSFPNHLIYLLDNPLWDKVIQYTINLNDCIRRKKLDQRYYVNNFKMEI
jgi:hypothetical protein